jgi:V/A-type H+-transporting ATPase subunit I
MAIAKIKKIELIGLNKDRDNLLGLLQKLGKVQLINIPQLDSVMRPRPAIQGPALLETEEAISFLHSFQGKAGFLEGIAAPKPIIYQEELKEIINSFDWQGFLKELSDLQNKHKITEQHREKLYQEKQILAPWQNLNIPLDEPHSTQKCGVLYGILRTADYLNLLKDCQKEKIKLFCEAVNQDKTNTYLVIIYIQDDFERLETMLKSRHFNFVTFSRHAGTVRNRFLEINREIMILDDQIKDVKDEFARLSKDRFKLMVIHDYLANINKLQETEGNLDKQQYTFILNGWIKASDVKALEKAIADNFKDAAIFISEPQGERVPIDLENKWIIRPFEFITKIYGMPKYNEIDPTPFLAPFFWLYFGLCVSDVGYGLMLIFICSFVLKRFKLGPQGLRFFRLFLFCGISTVIVGALMGSWFGDLLDIAGQANPLFLPLKRFKDSLVLLDPLKEPTKLLGIALMFGIIQVWFGNIVAAIGNIRNRRYLDIALDQAPMLAFLFGLTGSGLIFLRLIDNTHTNLFKYSVLFSAIALVLTQGRSEKGIGSKLFYGAYNLYNAFSGYLSDILSYSRIWALGLVTSVMASTVNLISVQFSQILVSTLPFLNRLSFLKILLSSLALIIIFVAGHTVSFFMNLLGAFVHPVRLQFVEFFSKFFKSGGESFKPFKVETKYINIS